MVGIGMLAAMLQLDRRVFLFLWWLRRQGLADSRPKLSERHIECTRTKSQSAKDQQHSGRDVPTIHTNPNSSKERSTAANPDPRPSVDLDSGDCGTSGP
jgi:hypothetical protein